MRDILIRIFRCFILPVLEYGCDFWDGCYESDKIKLENVQLEAARIACGLPVYCKKERVYFESGLEPLEHRRRRRKLVLFYKMHYGLTPQLQQDLLPPTVGNISNYPLRNRNDYSLPNNRLTLSEKSFISSTIIEWNALENPVREKSSIASFKVAITPQKATLPIQLHGNRKLNILHSRLRNRCSSLNYDLYVCNLTEDPSCRCGNPCENALHFFFECPTYTHQRQILETELRNFAYITLDMLLYGDAELSPESNNQLIRSTLQFIRGSNRF